MRFIVIFLVENEFIGIHDTKWSGAIQVVTRKNITLIWQEDQIGFHILLRKHMNMKTVNLLACYSHSLSILSITCSKIVNTNYSIRIKHFHMLCTKYINV
jgi:hypothetical protein